MCCLPNNNHLTSTTYEHQGHRQRQTRGNGSVENCGVVFLPKMLFFTSMDIKGKKKRYLLLPKVLKLGYFISRRTKKAFEQNTWSNIIYKSFFQSNKGNWILTTTWYSHLPLKKKERDTEKISVRPRSYVRSTASWKKWQREMVLTLMTIRTYIEHVLNRTKLHFNSKGLASLATNFIEFLRPISMLPSK